jgi:hypothetical protein
MTLKPTSKRLKQLIKAHGATGWTLVRAHEVACFDNHLGFFIRSRDGQHERWARPSDLEKE